MSAVPISMETPSHLTPETLSPQQVHAAHLLASGMHQTQVAKDLGIGRATLYRWSQDAVFAAYLHSLLRSLAEQATARSAHLLQLAQDTLEQQLTNPETPAATKCQLAFRICALYSRPSHLRYLQSLPDDPEAIALEQCRSYLRASGQTVPEDLDGEEAEHHYHQFREDRLAQAAAFDQRYPDPESLRDKMNQNETPALKPLPRTSARALQAAISGVTPALVPA